MLSTTYRRYYSLRTGKVARISIDLDEFRRLTIKTYYDFASDDYFQEAVGFGDRDGTLGHDPELSAFLKLGRKGLFPPSNDKPYTQDDLFDIIEFLHDHISKPTKKEYQGFDGWWVAASDKEAGKVEFRQRINEFLPFYGDGWELSENGEVQLKGEPGLSALFQDVACQDAPVDAAHKIALAVGRFRSHKSSIDDQREAVRNLADVLESLRNQAKELISRKDESDLFEIANRFGIRHHRDDQKTGYDQDIWLPWMFYYYLATIHALLRLIERPPF